MASPSLGTLQKEFLNYLTGVRGFSEHTRRSYDKAIDQFRAHLRDLNEQDTAHAFTDSAVLTWMTDLAGRGVKPSTIVAKLSGLSSFATYLMKRKTSRDKPILAANPTKMIDWPTAEAPETEFMRSEEVAAFLAVDLPLNEEVVRAVLIDTGARREELCRANIGDLVEMDGGWSLAVIVKGRGTRRRKVHMPLDPETVTLIRGHLADRGLLDPKAAADKPLLVNRQGRRYSGSTLQYLVTSIGTRAGFGTWNVGDDGGRFRLSPHKVRHTVNVIRDLGGVDEFRRARLLGQSSTRAQERYRHIVVGGLREAKDLQREGLAAYVSQKGLMAPTNGTPVQEVPGKGAES